MTLFYINLTALFVFLLSYKLEPRRLLNGFLFNILFLINALNVVYLAIQIPNLFIIFLLGLLLLNLLFFLFFGIYILIIALLINAKIVMKRERKTFANLLSLHAISSPWSHHLTRMHFYLPNLSDSPKTSYFSQRVRPRCLLLSLQSPKLPEYFIPLFNQKTYLPL